MPPKTDKPDVAKKIQLFSDRKTADATTQLGTRLVSDDKFRASFVKNPNKALADAGLKDLGQVQLTPRDEQLLNLLGDKQITELYRAGKFSDLQAHVSSRYADLIKGGGGLAASAVADFDVAIEVEAVAVAIVAVAAFAFGVVDRFQDVATLSSQFELLEKRVASLEGRR
jgi:putative modified peptide